MVTNMVYPKDVQRRMRFPEKKTSLTLVQLSISSVQMSHASLPFMLKRKIQFLSW